MCSSSLPVKHRKRLPGVRLFNEYGPTEGTVWCSAQEITHIREDEVVSIGRPVPHSRIYIVDENLKLLPRGAKGELVIAGDGLALGYHNRPDLTEDRFITQVPEDIPEKRIYRTGDLARWLKTGNLEFCGRIDDQIKMRGYRIEPGEIEACLETHSEVETAVVVARQRALPDDRETNEDSSLSHSFLIAFLKPNHPGTTPEINGIRRCLANKLPAYMIPHHFVFMPDLPVTSTGKIDRKVLTELGIDRQEPTDGPDLNASEGSFIRKLHDIWCDLLARTSVGPHDNFFELGGDSILAINVASRARQFGIQITVTDLFRHPTLAGLEPLLGTAELIAVEEVDAEGEIPLTPIQHYFAQLELPNPHYWHQTLLLELAEGISHGQISEILKHLLRVHPTLRLSIEEKTWKQVVVPFEEIEVEVGCLDLGIKDNFEGQRFIVDEANKLAASIRMDRPSLLRAAYFSRQGESNPKLLLVAHHMIVDAVTWLIIIQDLKELLVQSLRGHPFKLAPASTSFRQWAMTLNEVGQGDFFEKDFHYWSQRSFSPNASLPGDSKKTPQYTESEMEKLETTIDSGLLVDLGNHAQSRSQKLENILTSAFFSALVQWTGKPEQTIWIEGHGREDLFPGVDLSRTTGWFTSFFPVAFKSRIDASPEETIREVEATLRDIPHKGVGFGILRYLSRDPRVREWVERLPSPKVVFNYLGHSDAGMPKASPLSIVQEGVGTERDPSNTRKTELEANAYIYRNQLIVQWNYNAVLNDKATIQTVAEHFGQFLKDWSKFGNTRASSQAFADSGLDEEDLQNLFD